MDIHPLVIPDVKVLWPRKFGDHRGYFSETFNQRNLEAQGILTKFVQDNQALSSTRGTLRGLHYQTPPFAQDKLVRVLRGRILDVAVDIRRGSPTYGQYVSETLSAEDHNQILVPIGFAHAYLTLEPDTEVFYKVSNYYAPDNDAGLMWNDPDIGIKWPVGADEIVLSDKDQHQPSFRSFESPFTYSH